MACWKAEVVGAFSQVPFLHQYLMISPILVFMALSFKATSETMLKLRGNLQGAVQQA